MGQTMLSIIYYGIPIDNDFGNQEKWVKCPVEITKKQWTTDRDGAIEKMLNVWVYDFGVGWYGDADYNTGAFLFMRKYAAPFDCPKMLDPKRFTMDISSDEHEKFVQVLRAFGATPTVISKVNWYLTGCCC